METLTEKDVEILDFILKTAIQKGAVFPDDLPPLSGSFLGKAKEVKSKDYAYYLDLLKLYGIVEIEKNLSGFKISPIHIKTNNFYNQGGFKAIYDKQQFDLKRKQEFDDISFRKLKSDAKLSKWQVKTFWWIFALACFGGLYSIYDLTNKIISKKQDQEILTKPQMELELSKLRTLILDHKKIDSVDIDKINKDTLKKK